MSRTSGSFLCFPRQIDPLNIQKVFRTLHSRSIMLFASRIHFVGKVHKKSAVPNGRMLSLDGEGRTLLFDSLFNLA